MRAVGFKTGALEQQALLSRPHREVLVYHQTTSGGVVPPPPGGVVPPPPGGVVPPPREELFRHHPGGVVPPPPGGVVPPPPGGCSATTGRSRTTTTGRSRTTTTGRVVPPPPGGGVVPPPPGGGVVPPPPGGGVVPPPPGGVLFRHHRGRCWWSSICTHSRSSALSVTIVNCKTTAGHSCSAGRTIGSTAAPPPLPWPPLPFPAPENNASTSQEYIEYRLGLPD